MLNHSFADTLIAASLAVLIYVTTVFILAVIIRRNDVADVAWGTGFIVAGSAGLIFTHNRSLPAILAFALVLIWGARLTWHIGRRNIKKSEDYRYKAWRDSWGKWFYIRSYFQVFLFQGVLILSIVSPLLLIDSYSGGGLTILLTVGAIIWLVGFIFEAVGDQQLAVFLSDPKNKGHIIQTGLWRYSRHPNYFGEVTQWWGIGILALSYQNGLWGLVGPIVISTLILKISGVPILEKKYADRPDFQEYKHRTSLFFPLPVKRAR